MLAVATMAIGGSVSAEDLSDEIFDRRTLPNCGYYGANFEIANYDAPAVDEGDGIVSMFARRSGIINLGVIDFADCEKFTSVRFRRDEKFWSGEEFGTETASLAKVASSASDMRPLTLSKIAAAGKRQGFSIENGKITADSTTTLCACEVYYPQSAVGRLRTSLRPN